MPLPSSARQPLAAPSVGDKARALLCADEDVKAAQPDRTPGTVKALRPDLSPVLPGTAR